MIEETLETQNSKMKIQEELQLFPLCIVWTVIPCISWLFPFIGHTGICE